MKDIKINLKDLLKNKNILTVVGFIIICTISLNKIYTKEKLSITKLKAEIVNEKNKNDLYSKINDLDKKIDKYASDKAFSLKDRTLLLDKVSVLAAGNKLEIDSINFEAEVERDFYIFIPIDLSLIGRFHDFGKFVSEVESSEHFLKFVKVTVSELKDKETGEIKHNFKAIINAVIVKD